MIQLIATSGDAIVFLAAGAKAVKTAIGWARTRWQKDKDDHPHEPPRPRSIELLYGPDGRVLGRITIDLPDGEPIQKDSPEL